ncbi:MAG: hypothetical protein IKZ46_10330 [Victivallales bacterium]|nr:hypothetical protein [Victivallales bacterium]
MSQEVTQKNVHLFIPAKAAKIISRIQQERNIELKEALLAFYRSSIYHMLETESTKLWHKSGEQIYEEYSSQGLVRKTFKTGPRHSKLEPYAAQILVWRHQGMTIRTISLNLAQVGCMTTAQNIWFFLQRHYGLYPCRNRKTVS